MDLGFKLRSWEASPERISNFLPNHTSNTQGAAAGTVHPLEACALDAKYFLALDSIAGTYFFDVFYLVADGEKAQVWVQANLGWEYDARLAPIVDCQQAAYMLNQFEQNILPEETEFFGPADMHDGSASLLEAWGYFPPGYYHDETGRQLILVENIRDDNFYDDQYPFYIAGFYSSSLEAYTDRNIISIDAMDWENRIGPEANHPFLYEGVFAHEYQHLLHADYDADEEIWINEGMSDLAIYLTGYGHSKSHVDFFLEHPENSLVLWQDQGPLEILADYGIAYLWTLYLLEQYGSDLIRDLFSNQENGMQSVDTSLEKIGACRDFQQTHHDFLVALTVDSDRVRTLGRRHRCKCQANPYLFESIDVSLNLSSPDAQDSFGAPPWGADFLLLKNDRRPGWLHFDGDDVYQKETAWISDGQMLYSQAGDLLDHWAIFQAQGGGVLSFDTWYDIEPSWDFGFVQVSTDGGATWVSMQNAYTTMVHDPSAHPTVVENLPGLTGYSDGWQTMSFDLSAYAGQTIHIALRYVTDWTAAYEGWYVDNIAVDGELISDGSDNTQLSDITQLMPIPLDFYATMVTIVQKKNKTKTYVRELRLNDNTEQGKALLMPTRKDTIQQILLVGHAAGAGMENYAGYTVQIKKFGHHRDKDCNDD